MSENPLSVARPGTIEDLLSKPGIKSRFDAMLGARAPQFLSSIIQVYKGFTQQVEPSSVIAAAATAATLDLPIEKGLGIAHIVPYAGRAQFQIGYKGFIQLALRSGQYRKMNAKRINAEAFLGYDDVGDPIIDWSKVDETEEPAGYAFAWQLVNGFTKVVYWQKSKVEAHAARFSQAYRAKKQDSPWFTAFDAMALKTVVKDGLSHWGILSVQMQNALSVDQVVKKDIDDTGEFIDGGGGAIQIPESKSPARLGSGDDGDLGPQKKKRVRQGGTAPGEAHNLAPAGSTPAPAPSHEQQQTPPPAEPEPPKLRELKPISLPAEPTPQQVTIALTHAIIDDEVQEDEVMWFLRSEGQANEAQTRLEHLATRKLIVLCEDWPRAVKAIREMRQAP